MPGIPGFPGHARTLTVSPQAHHPHCFPELNMKAQGVCAPCVRPLPRAPERSSNRLWFQLEGWGSGLEKPPSHHVRAGIAETTLGPLLQGLVKGGSCSWEVSSAEDRRPAPAPASTWLAFPFPCHLPVCQAGKLPAGESEALCILSDKWQRAKQAPILTTSDSPHP